MLYLSGEPVCLFNMQVGVVFVLSNSVWLNLEIVLLSEISQRKTNMITLIYGILKKGGPNELIYKTEMELQK